MKVLGVAVKMTAKRALVSCVLVDDEKPADEAFNLGLVNVETNFDIPVDEDDLAAQLRDVSIAIEGRARTLRPDRVVVRRADFAPHASQQESRQFRLLLEGAMTAAIKTAIPDTVIKTGKECALMYGAAKSVLDDDAKTLFRKGSDAAVASLAGLAEGR
jgi:hypothetical protein